MLAWLKIGPRKTGLEMPAVANHLVRMQKTYWIVCPKVTASVPKISTFRDWPGRLI